MLFGLLLDRNRRKFFAFLSTMFLNCWWGCINLVIGLLLSLHWDLGLVACLTLNHLIDELFFQRHLTLIVKVVLINIGGHSAAFSNIHPTLFSAAWEFWLIVLIPLWVIAPAIVCAFRHVGLGLFYVYALEGRVCTISWSVHFEWKCWLVSYE